MFHKRLLRRIIKRILLCHESGNKKSYLNQQCVTQIFKRNVDLSAEIPVWSKKRIVRLAHVVQKFWILPKPFEAFSNRRSYPQQMGLKESL